MSFAGGGSDIASYFHNFGGAVISTAINKYVYVNVNQKFDNGIRVGYSINEEVSNVDDIEHHIVKEALKHLDIKGGIEITTIADIPSKGTGLGSSSTFTVGLLNALNAFKSKHISCDKLAQDSCYIEIEKCGAPIGKQDQYAAAYGGFNLIEFNPDNSVVVNPIICDKKTIQTLESSILVFYTGITRSASNLLLAQSEIISSSKDKQDVMHKMVSLARTLAKEVQNNNPDVFGEVLHEGWLLKKSISDEISNAEIDEWYQIARKAGARGGRILGAGAGGFLMLSAPLELHEHIKSKLHMLRYTPIQFERLGSRILFYED
ncbi:GHMP kinase [Polynucleobacter sp. 86C-FISCH]|uniref:GHMP family kinase ATP-binding protein n=1 Tax=Polynucleobacter sp. 86C-FISCH TaxID=2689101 RepID=UPI001C0CA3EF|nr:GHMP kinase [Polynucleobacter sp. 86C-FISCH]